MDLREGRSEAGREREAARRARVTETETRHSRLPDEPETRYCAVSAVKFTGPHSLLACAACCAGVPSELSDSDLPSALSTAQYVPQPE